MDLNLQDYRKKYKLTQAALADHLGVSFQSVSKWETQAAYPDIHTLMKLADLFDVSLDTLVGRKAPKQQQQTQGHKLHYLKKTREDMWNDDYLEFLVKKVWKFNTPINILDFGCGYGYLGLKLLPILPLGSTYTGLEVRQDLIQEARKLFSATPFDATFIQADPALYRSEASYDLCLCQAVLRHRDSPEKIIKNMVASTSIGGKVVCIEVNRLIEEIAYYHSHKPYEPMTALRFFEGFWKKDSRDYAVAIKVPSLLHKHGLVNVDARLNDRILCTHDKDQCLDHMNIRGWCHDDLEGYLCDYRLRLLGKGHPPLDVEAYLDLYRANVKAVQDMTPEDTLTFFRGMIISYGDKK